MQSEGKNRLRNTLNMDVSKTDANAVHTNKSGPASIMSQQRAERELVSAKETISTLMKRKIKISDIYRVEGRKRSLTPEKYAELKDNLSNNPLIHAVVVRVRPEGGYELIAGYNRVEIYEELGRDEIEADIKEFGDEDAVEAAFYSNLFTSELSDFEKFSGFKEIQKRTNESQRDLAKRAGVTEGQISRLFSFDKLPADALELIKSEPYSLGYNNASKLVNANSERIIEAIAKLVKGEINEMQAVNHALAKVKPTQSRGEPTVIKVGKKYFAEVNHKGGLVTVKLKDESLAAEIRNQIEKIIKDASEKT